MLLQLHNYSSQSSIDKYTWNIFFSFTVNIMFCEAYDITAFNHYFSIKRFNYSSTIGILQWGYSSSSLTQSGNQLYQPLSFNTASGYQVLNIQFKPNTIFLSKILAVVSFQPITNQLNLKMVSQYISNKNPILGFMDPISAISGSWQFINIAIPSTSKPFFITIFNFDLPELVSDKTFTIILNYMNFGKICKPCVFGSSLLINSENPLSCQCSPCKDGYTGTDCKIKITQLVQNVSVSKDIHKSEPLFFKIKNQGYDIVLTVKEITSTNGITMYVQYESEVGCIAGKLNNYHDNNSPLRMLLTPQKASRVINHKSNNILLAFQNTANTLSSFSVNYQFRDNKDQGGIARLYLVIGLSFLGAIFILIISCKIYRTIKLRSIVINSRTSSSKQNRRSFTHNQIQRLFPEVTAESIYEESSISKKGQYQLIQCSICFDTIRKKQLVRITQCHHSFHSLCLVQWLKSSSVYDLIFRNALNANISLKSYKFRNRKANMRKVNNRTNNHKSKQIISINKISRKERLHYLKKNRQIYQENLELATLKLKNSLVMMIKLLKFDQISFIEQIRQPEIGLYYKVESEYYPMEDIKGIQSYINQIQKCLHGQQYKKIVLQIPKIMLPMSFDISNILRRKNPQRQFFILYDSLKNSCCVDKLGAQHIGYDCLIHFGQACFSSDFQANHYFIFAQPDKYRIQEIKATLVHENFKKQIFGNNIGYIIIQQPYYRIIKALLQQLSISAQILRLPFDVTEGCQYLMFGYYFTNKQQAKNVLIIGASSEQNNGVQFNFVQKISLAFKSVQGKLGQRLLTIGDGERQRIVQQKINSSKRLMQRYSIISQLQDQNVFGILVSNTGTSFVESTIKRCEYILKKHNKKVFLFMMNNLNEVKLGNFPEIDVYVIVSCHNNSLFSVKDFHKLAIAPIDLEIAFQKKGFQQYGFDLKSGVKQIPIFEKDLSQKEDKSQNSLDLLKNKDLMLQNKIQTLSFYKDREYKGLQFSQKKEIKKLTKGKIGLAQQYTNIQ